MAGERTHEPTNATNRTAHILASNHARLCSLELLSDSPCFCCRSSEVLVFHFFWPWFSTILHWAPGDVAWVNIGPNAPGFFIQPGNQPASTIGSFLPTWQTWQAASFRKPGFSRLSRPVSSVPCW